MGRSEIDALVQQIREAPLSFEAPAPQLREIFEGMLESFPQPETEVVAADIAGVQVLMDADQTVDAPVLLYLHGGAYVAGTASGYRSLWLALADAGHARGVAPEYRLAPEAPFPAALDDAVAVYSALLDDGVRPDRIALAGDSAGGGLALALMLSLRDAGMPLPACAVLLSPWLDLSCTSTSMKTKAQADPSLTPAGLMIRAAEYLGDEDAAHHLASPLHADLQDLPPLLVVAGTAEILLSDATTLAARCGEADVRVTLEIWPHLVHVFPLFAFALPEGRQALDSAGAFIRQRTGLSTPRSH
ncbi:alpha/beta hydrolase [Streptomyces sp. NPDC058335]|uniref:alpha/beta hydrolase n=1 Tax=Streptomyces sp. NPDC058335 TaxID=3346451 RepID=UPI00364D8B70